MSAAPDDHLEPADDELDLDDEDEVELDDVGELAEEDWSEFTYGVTDEDGGF
ncbi:MAG: hypothetical protein ACR2JV_02240 [Gaiellales bacterium]